MAEFKSLVDKMNKQKEYKSDVTIKEDFFKDVDGVSSPLLKQDIAIQA